MSSLKELLSETLKRQASDLHLAAESPPQVRVDGGLVPLELPPLDSEQVRELCYEAIDARQRDQFEEEHELDFAFTFENRSRFRGNLYLESGSVAGAFRSIPLEIPTPESLGIPLVAMRMTEKPRGLVLVTGPTGSGKTTTLASMLEKINQLKACHIMTIEDPIEYVYKSKKSLINQREVGNDTQSFKEGLKHLLRQDPDVVLIGEMRDLETIAAAITISETGHLVFATLHTNTTVESVNRMIDVFPAHQQAQIRTQLSFVLVGVLSQKLLPKKGGGRVLAMEILIPNYAIRNLIREDKVHQIPSHMIAGREQSEMQTMDQALAVLVNQGIIERELALAHSSEPKELEKLLGPNLKVQRK